MVNVTNRAHIDMRLRTFKFAFCHHFLQKERYASLSV